MQQTYLEILQNLPVTRLRHLEEAFERSEDRIRLGRNSLGDALATQYPTTDVIAFGSLARREVTNESDFDYLVLIDGIPSSPDAPSHISASADRLRSVWALESGRGDTPPVRGPGASGLFGSVVGAFDLVEQVGLQRDTNHSLTRRMLLLEESVSLLNMQVREMVVRAALDRYLTLPGVRPDGVPRYLLNDVIRYWRTVSVDYQAKANSQGASGLRYIKLLIPRKVQFASMLMSLLLCGRLPGHEATTDSLLDELDKPSLARLLSPFEQAPRGTVRDAMCDVALTVDWYLGQSGNLAWREAVGARPTATDGGSTEYREAKVMADRLQTSLEAIFFGWDLINREARSKLVF